MTTRHCSSNRATSSGSSAARTTAGDADNISPGGSGMACAAVTTVTIAVANDGPYPAHRLPTDDPTGPFTRRFSGVSGRLPAGAPDVRLPPRYVILRTVFGVVTPTTEGVIAVRGKSFGMAGPAWILTVAALVAAGCTDGGGGSASPAAGPRTSATAGVPASADPPSGGPASGGPASAIPADLRLPNEGERSDAAEFTDWTTDNSSGQPWLLDPCRPTSYPTDAQRAAFRTVSRTGPEARDARQLAIYPSPEIDRRLHAARTTDPATNQRERLQTALTTATASITRMIEAFQEQLITIDELRARMPDLRARETGLHAQLDALHTQIADREIYLKLADDLEGFLAQLHDKAETTTVEQRQHVLRLLVKDVLVGPEKITIRHRIPIRERTATSQQHPDADSEGDQGRSYPLRRGRDRASAGEHRHPHPERHSALTLVVEQAPDQRQRRGQQARPGHPEQRPSHDQHHRAHRERRQHRRPGEPPPHPSAATCAARSDPPGCPS
jgi:hypothetical protein